MHNNNKIYIETYGCQMNLSDTEVVSSILKNADYSIIDDPSIADVIFLNTCSVRENAENTIYKRLTNINKYKRKNEKLVVGILGCMAERLQSKLIGEKNLVSLVVGPDEYRNLPGILENALNGEKGIAVKLSGVETYEDIIPFRTDGISAWLSIMRGCNNYCSYCVVPYVRGRERSRSMVTIIEEVKKLYADGFKEVTLLGQNVNSYKAPDTGSDFADLLRLTAETAPKMRFRFITSHPRDMSDKLIETMADYDNICKHIHLPVQSGSDRILKLMNRKYSINHYLGRIEKIRELMPGCVISTDIIAGFPSETENDHKATLQLLKTVRYDGAFMFKYSSRTGTISEKRFIDDVPPEEKGRRLTAIIELQEKISLDINKTCIDKTVEVLVEGESKRNPNQLFGKTDGFKTTVFPKDDAEAGQFVKVKITDATAHTLLGEIVSREGG